MKKFCSAAAAWFLFATLSAQGADGNMKAFPPAKKGMVRYVLQVPKQDDESAFKVELVVGKTVQVDAVNKYFFAGKIEEETIEGWGFPRYILRKLGPMAGTLMAVDPNSPKVDRFITVGGEPNLLRYNSRLPIVVYVPEGVEVRYRIWTAGAEAKAVEKAGAALVEPGLPSKCPAGGAAPRVRRRQDQRVWLARSSSPHGGKKDDVM